MVTRFLPSRGMEEAPNGDYVEYSSFEQLKAEYASSIDLVLILLGEIEAGERSAAEAARAVRMVVRIE